MSAFMFVIFMNITIVKLALPDSVAQTLKQLAPDGVDVAQYSVAVLTEHCAVGRIGHREPKTDISIAASLPIRRPNSQSHSLQRRVSEGEMLDAIVAYLKTKGGSAAKPEVENAVFKEYEVIFNDPYYTELVGGGVPRWKKNVQFASNTGRNLGLLKSPEESGRGIWALTEKC